MTGSHGEHGKTWWGINCFKWFNQQNHTENWWARENTERILEPKVRMWSNKMSIRGLWDGYSQSRVLSQTQPTKKRMKKGMKKEWKRYMANKNVGSTQTHKYQYSRCRKIFWGSHGQQLISVKYHEKASLRRWWKVMELVLFNKIWAQISSNIFRLSAKIFKGFYWSHPKSCLFVANFLGG